MNGTYAKGEHHVNAPTPARKATYLKRLALQVRSNKSLYVMIIPVVAFYVLFCYLPMYGAVIAFKEFSPGKGILASPWVGLQHFQDFFSSMYFGRILRNTVTISISMILAGFPAPILLALLINEVRNKYFAKTVQTFTYLPHFISLVVICGLIRDFVSSSGIITQLLSVFGFPARSLLEKARYFVPIYVISGIWQEVGWGSIIYLAALSGIDPELYEAARIDGAGRWKQTIHITLPSLLPTVMIMLILRMGGIMHVGFEKIILLYNPLTYETADVISSFVYRKGLLEFSWSYSSAVGLFNSVVNFAFLLGSNALSKKINGSGLW